MDTLELDIATKLPDHTQLPCEDGTIVKNFQEHPQSILLTESIWSKLQDIHPDKQFCIGQDSGIIGGLLTLQRREQKHQIGFMFLMCHLF
jgi:hypothetical protein